MKLAFTTLGCPEWDLATTIARAKEYGFDGVDFRGYLEDMEIFRRPEFSSQINQTIKQFADAGIEVPCFSSSVRLFHEASENQKMLDEVKAYLELCQAFGATMIRIFGGKIGDTPRDQALDRAVANYTRMVEIAEPYGVQLLLETHDDWIASEHVKALMQGVGSPLAAVLWDVHHTYRMEGEAMAETVDALKPWLRYTHWKDSRLAPEAKMGYELCLTGEGDIPLAEAFEAIVAAGYDGWLTLEWEKRWHPDIAEADVEYPNYVKYMRKLMG